ncbi:hypothetical protein ACFLYD_07670, partial [Chloroflexota bacterium]
PLGCIVGLVVGGILLVVILVLVFGGRGGAEEWVRATRANGSWTTTVLVLGPQMAVEERWETDCVDDPSGAVRSGACILKDTNAYHDTVVDDYEEFAYDIYYEETWDKVYEVQGTEFVVTALGRDDWWQENLHYSLEEELDKESCEYSSYTLWVDDAGDSAQETEVYLSECEVWDHVTVSERVYEQALWCECEVTSLVQLGQQSAQGVGAGVQWAAANVPSGGQTEESFQGQVTFLGDDYTYTVTTTDPSQYRRYLEGDYYIGLRDGRPVAISDRPQEE